MEKANPVVSIFNSILAIALVLIGLVASAYVAGIAFGLTVEAFESGLSLIR